MSITMNNNNSSSTLRTYSVLRFFNRLKEPDSKSLILLNLRSLQNRKEYTNK